MSGAGDLIVTRARDPRVALRVRLWVVAIAAAGLLGVLAPVAGAVADAALLVALALGSRRSSAAAGLLLVPMLRLLWVAMPMRGLASLHWIPLIAVPFLVVALLVARSGGLRPAGFGIQLGGTLAGGLAVVTGWTVAGVATAVVAGDEVAWGRTGGAVAWAAVLVYAPLVAVAEEVALRGVLPAMLAASVFDEAMPVAIAAAATLALGAGSPWWVAIAIATAVVNGVVVMRTGSLLAVIVGHALFLVALNL